MVYNENIKIVKSCLKMCFREDIMNCSGVIKAMKAQPKKKKYVMTPCGLKGAL